MNEVAAANTAIEEVDYTMATQNEPLIMDPLAFDDSEADPLSSDAVVNIGDIKSAFVTSIDKNKTEITVAEDKADSQEDIKENKASDLDKSPKNDPQIVKNVEKTTEIQTKEPDSKNVDKSHGDNSDTVIIPKNNGDHNYDLAKTDEKKVNEEMVVEKSDITLTEVKNMKNEGLMEDKEESLKDKIESDSEKESILAKTESEIDYKPENFKGISEMIEDIKEYHKALPVNDNIALNVCCAVLKEEKINLDNLKQKSEYESFVNGKNENTESKVPKAIDDNKLVNDLVNNVPNEVISSKSEPIAEIIDVEQSKSAQKKDKMDIVVENNVELVEVKDEVINLDNNINENATASNKSDIKEEVNEPESENNVKINGEKKHEEELPQKRASSIEINEDLCPSKKLCQEIEKAYPEHDKMINDFILNASKNNVDEIQQQTEQLLNEINTLRELAQKKEQEWNNILHLKKVKEEVLLRLLRKRQVLSFEKSPNTNRTDLLENGSSPKDLTIDKSDEISGVALKQPIVCVNSTRNNTPPAPPQVPSVSRMYEMLHSIPEKPIYTQPFPRPILPKPPAVMMGTPSIGAPKLPGYNEFSNGQFSFAPMGRQGPIKDVKSIIADYRQKNPEQLQQTPRRGRRMKSILNPQAVQMTRLPGPQSHDSRINDLGMLLNSIDMSQKSMLERLTQQSALSNGMSFKDVLVQFANMQQNAAAAAMMGMNSARMGQEPHHKLPENMKEKNPPPPYPEISLHPVSNSNTSNIEQQSSSLLHGILTKNAENTNLQQKSPSSTPQPGSTQQYPAFSPTLAKLLKERAADCQQMSDSASNAAALVQAKNCGEITITPVHSNSRHEHQTQLEEKRTEGEVVQLDDEESVGSEGSGDGSSRRLVIDESVSTGGPSAQSDVPICQGCRRKHAQFVCAGCANQWYCSRECQVAAWDDHSEMCSG